MQEDTKDFLEQLERVRWERHVVSCKRELTCSAKSLSAGVRKARALLSNLHRNTNRNSVKPINDKWIRKCPQLITIHSPHRTDPPPGPASMFFRHRFGTLTFVFGTSDISDCFLSL